MKAGKVILAAGVLIGAYVVYKLISRQSDPTVTSIAQAQYGTTQGVNGLIGAAIGNLSGAVGSIFGGGSNTNASGATPSSDVSIDGSFLTSGLGSSNTTDTEYTDTSSSDLYALV